MFGCDNLVRFIPGALIAVIASATPTTSLASVRVTHRPNVLASRDTAPLFFEHQVTESVQILAWKPPTYPPKLKAERVEGVVLLEFIVDTAGRMEERSLKVVRS